MSTFDTAVSDVKGVCKYLELCFEEHGGKFSSHGGVCERATDLGHGDAFAVAVNVFKEVDVRCGSGSGGSVRGVQCTDWPVEVADLYEVEVRDVYGSHRDRDSEAVSRGVGDAEV